MHVGICHPGRPRANTPHSTRIQKAISGYSMVFCPVRLISSCKGHKRPSASLQTVYTFIKIKNHTEEEGEPHEVTLYFNFFTEGQVYVMRLTKEQFSGLGRHMKRNFPASKGENRSLTILMGSFWSIGLWY